MREQCGSARRVSELLLLKEPCAYVAALAAATELAGILDRLCGHNRTDHRATSAHELFYGGPRQKEEATALRSTFSVATCSLASSFITYFYGSSHSKSHDHARQLTLREVAKKMRHCVREAEKTYDRRTGVKKKQEGTREIVGRINCHQARSEPPVVIK